MVWMVSLCLALPSCCHPARCSCSQSTVYLWDRQTPPTCGPVSRMLRTHGTCWPQSRPPTWSEGEDKKGKVYREERDARRITPILWKPENQEDPRHRPTTSWETGSNCPKSCPMVMAFGFTVLKMTFSSSLHPLSFKRVRVSASTCSTLVFPEKGSPTSMNLKYKKRNLFMQKCVSETCSVQCQKFGTVTKWNITYPCLTIIIS